MIGFALILFAAFWKSIADTIEHHKGKSVFRNKKFWSNGTGKHLPLSKYPFDGWHVSNSMMIVSFVVAAVLHEPSLAWYFEIPIAGIGFILVFNIFYNKIWIK